MLEIARFEIDGFIVPAFILENGKLARLWIESSSIGNSKEVDGYKLKEKLRVLFSKKNNTTKGENNNRFYPVEKVKQNGFLKYFTKPSLKHILVKKGIVLDDERISTLDFFEIDINAKLELIGFRKQTLFEIFIGFCKWNNLIFDYGGLGPIEEAQLTVFVIHQVNTGKTAIGFDRLCMISDINHNERILNVEIKIPKQASSLPNKIKDP